MTDEEIRMKLDGLEKRVSSIEVALGFLGFVVLIGITIYQTVLK